MTTVAGPAPACPRGSASRRPAPPSSSSGFSCCSWCALAASALLGEYPVRISGPWRSRDSPDGRDLRAPHPTGPARGDGRAPRWRRAAARCRRCSATRSPTPSSSASPEARRSARRWPWRWGCRRLAGPSLFAFVGRDRRDGAGRLAGAGAPARSPMPRSSPGSSSTPSPRRSSPASRRSSRPTGSVRSSTGSPGRLGYERPRTLLVAASLQLVASALLWAESARLNLLSLGDDEAASLGVPVRRTRALVLLAASLGVAGGGGARGAGGLRRASSCRTCSGCGSGRTSGCSCPRARSAARRSWCSPTPATRVLLPGVPRRAPVGW